MRERLRRGRDAMKELAERRVVDLDASASVRLRLAVQREGVGEFRDDDLRHERRAEVC